MTPLAIKMALHYYCQPVDFPGVEHPAQQEIIKYFLATGLLELSEVDNTYCAYCPTDKLCGYVETICSIAVED